MKYGRTLEELLIELDRQNKAKKDYQLATSDMVMDAGIDGEKLTLINRNKNENLILNMNEVAHDQIGTALKIPAKYYDRMRKENPELLALNVNSWLKQEPEMKMIRTLDGTARAFLSDKYRRIDNAEIAVTSLNELLELGDGLYVESCEVTDRRMYIKAVNKRLEAEVFPGDIVQSGIIISNSEVGVGALSIQPLVYRLVCSNGMVVNDAATRRRHIGRRNEVNEDFSIYTSETMKIDDMALMMKVRDTVRAVIEQTQFDKVVNMMRNAKEAKITAPMPAMVELGGSEFGYSISEGKTILDKLIRRGDYTLYGYANAVTEAAQDSESYDRSTEMESIGYTILGMPADKWRKLQNVEPSGKVA